MGAGSSYQALIRWIYSSDDFYTKLPRIISATCGSFQNERRFWGCFLRQMTVNTEISADLILGDTSLTVLKR